MFIDKFICYSLFHSLLAFINTEYLLVQSKIFVEERKERAVRKCWVQVTQPCGILLKQAEWLQSKFYFHISVFINSIFVIMFVDQSENEFVAQGKTSHHHIWLPIHNTNHFRVQTINKDNNFFHWQRIIRH